MLSYRTIEPHTLELLKKLTANPLLRELRLVGGTASEEKQKKNFSEGINSLSGAWRNNGLSAEEEIRQIYDARTLGETRTLLDL